MSKTERRLKKDYKRDRRYIIKMFHTNNPHIKFICSVWDHATFGFLGPRSGLPVSIRITRSV